MLSYHSAQFIQPFEDPNTKKKYTEKKFGAHVASQAMSLLGSTLFGICMTVGLHYYKGMIVGLAIQSIMGPLNLLENALAKTVLMGGGLGDGVADRKIFGEKNRNELTKDDEVVDEQGNVVVRKPLPASAAADGKKGGGKKQAAPKKDERSFEDILLDTWDLGADADMKPLMAALTKKTVNYHTKDDSWTPSMILAAIGVANTKECLAKCKSLGGNPAAVDKEGWNALHWAAFHGSPAGATYLLSKEGFAGIDLADAKDKEGKSPLDHAKAEGNKEVATIIENALASRETSASDDGLRKRK